MTPNKVQHFQEWLEGFKKKPVIIKLSSLPTIVDYEKLGNAGIYGAEAGEKLRKSILQFQNAQTE